MGETESQPSMSSLSLDVAVPCDARYLPMLRQLAERTVEYIGYHASRRDEVVRTIDHAVSGVFGPGDTAYTNIELQLATTQSDMQVRIRYLGAPANTAGPTPIEQLLSRPDGDGVPLERLRRGMQTVVLGREAGGGGADFCELTRALPSDP